MRRLPSMALAALPRADRLVHARRRALRAEFFSLAAVWLRCRHDLLTFEPEKQPFAFLGEVDYQIEIETVAREFAATLSP